jgi:hypothetical protein
MLTWLACPLLMPAQHSLAGRLDAKERQLEQLIDQLLSTRVRDGADLINQPRAECP